jgi:DNA anti-recombination protein RmuC
MKNKNIGLAFALLSAAALAAGCNKSGDESSRSVSEQMDNVKKETKEDAQNIKDYAYAEKAEFVAKMQTHLADINRELDEISVKIEKSSDTVKAEAKPKMQALREQAKDLGKQLDDVKASSESNWNDVKAGFKKGYADFSDGVNKARQWVSDKIAP